MPREAHLTNPSTCRILHCTPTGLRALKCTFKAELHEQWAGGQPLLGQLPSESDPDGSIRAELWAEVTRKNAVFGALLAGERYAPGVLPERFEEGVRKVKEKIFRDLNGEVRRGIKRRGGLEGVRRAAARGVSTPDAPSRNLFQAEGAGPPQGRVTGWEDSGSTSCDVRGDSIINPAGELAGLVDTGSKGRLSDSKENGSTETGSPRRRSRGTSSPPLPTVLPHPPRGTTLPAAISRVQELETCVSRHEELLKEHDARVEERVMKRVARMFADRDGTIERLQWYLEGAV